MNVAAEYWYNGTFAEYKDLPWLHEMKEVPPMPWLVVDVSPHGYHVYCSLDGFSQKFKMLTKPIVVPGDTFK